MKIFYVNVIEENAGWGAECFVNRGFQLLGHKTHCLDFRKHRYNLYKIFLEASYCDVFFLQRGDNFPKPLIRAINLPRFFWASERFNRDQDRLLNSGLFDHIFFHTNDWLERAVAKGWVKRENCSVLLNGFDETIHRIITNTKRTIDILFIGALTERRKKILSELVKDFNITIASAYGSQFIELLNRAKIVLNIHSFDYLDTETRVFEVLACGAFLLTEKLSEENPFSDKDFVQFDNQTDLKEKLKFYLTHEKERLAIADHGHKTALEKHTYTMRAKEIAGIMQRHLDNFQKSNRPMLTDDWKLRKYRAREIISGLGYSAYVFAKRIAKKIIKRK